MKRSFKERLKLKGKQGMVQRKPLKSLIVFFLSIHIFFGIDYGFANLFSGKRQSFFKIYSTLLFILIFIAILHPFTYLYKTIWYWVNAVGLALYFILLMRTRYSVFSLLIDFHNLKDVNINNGIFVVITSIHTYLLFISKVSISCVNCYLGTNSVCTDFPIGSYELYTVASNIIDFYPVSTIVISYYIYIVVKQMKSVLVRDADIGNFIRLYKTVADSCYKIRPLYDNIVSILASLYIV